MAKSTKNPRCTLCGRPVRKSWVTGILWKRCRTCRYLVMMYGPSIQVKLTRRTPR